MATSVTLNPEQAAFLEGPLSMNVGAVKAETARRMALKPVHRALNARYARALGSELAALGFGAALVDGLVTMLTATDLVALRFAPQIVFEQTPGPEAGRVLLPP